MGKPPETVNRSVAHGQWGEDVAVECLRRAGLTVIERNARPVRADRRLEIDIVAYERASDTLVFVEVKQHAVRSPYARRLSRVDRRKRTLLRRACQAWRRKNGCLEGGYRFDVVEVWGEPGAGTPFVDHIRDVRLFRTREKFIKWS